MAVRTEQSFARHAEAFQMHLMADTVAGRRKTHALGGSHALQIKVVVAVFGTALEHIVVNVRNRKFGFDLIGFHRFQFQISHRSGGILSQSLVDLDRHGLTGDLGARYIMSINNFLNNSTFCHNPANLSIKMNYL